MDGLSREINDYDLIIKNASLRSSTTNNNICVLFI